MDSNETMKANGVSITCRACDSELVSGEPGVWHCPKCNEAIIVMTGNMGITTEPGGILRIGN